jgi:hypothetical protein
MSGPVQATRIRDRRLTMMHGKASMGKRWIGPELAGHCAAKALPAHDMLTGKYADRTVIC